MANPSILDQDPAARPGSETTNDSAESFGDILSQYEQSHTHKPDEGGRGLEGTVIAISGESVFLDIGYKIEGIIPVAEFQAAGDSVKPGDKMPVSIKGRDPEGYYGLGTVYLGFKEFDAASEEFKKAEQLYLELNSPLVLDAQFSLGVTYYQMKDYEKSIDYLERVYAKKQNDSRVNYYLGLSYLDKGDTDRAAKHLKRAQQLGAKIPREVSQKAGI